MEFVLIFLEHSFIVSLIGLLTYCYAVRYHAEDSSNEDDTLSDDEDTVDLDEDLSDTQTEEADS